MTVSAHVVFVLVILVIILFTKTQRICVVAASEYRREWEREWRFKCLIDGGAGAGAGAAVVVISIFANSKQTHR